MAKKQGREEQRWEEGREGNSNGEVRTGVRTGLRTGLRTAAQTNSRAATANTQKRALQSQGSYNLKTPPKTPEEIAQEALLRYERKRRK